MFILVVALAGGRYFLCYSICSEQTIMCSNSYVKSHKCQNLLPTIDYSLILCESTCAKHCGWDRSVLTHFMLHSCQFRGTSTVINFRYLRFIASLKIIFEQVVDVYLVLPFYPVSLQFSFFDLFWNIPFFSAKFQDKIFSFCFSFRISKWLDRFYFLFFRPRLKMMNNICGICFSPLKFFMAKIQYVNQTIITAVCALLIFFCNLNVFLIVISVVRF